jgi:GTPase SAR1 family protein
MPFVIKRLEPNLIPNRSSLLFLGKRNSGKTTAAVQLLGSEQFQNHRVCVWVGTEPGVKFWSDVLGSSATVKRPDTDGESYATCLLNSQNGMHPSSPFYEIVMIFDDITSDKWFCRKTGVLAKLFTQGRHYGITVVVCCQYLKQLPPVVRDNTDYFFVLSIPKKTIRTLYNDYFEYPETVDQLFGIIRAINSMKDKYTSKKVWGCMVYNNSGKRNDIELITCFQKPLVGSLSNSIGCAQRPYLNCHYRGSIQKRFTADQMKHTSFAIEDVHLQ